MKVKAVSGIILTLLLTSMLTLAFNIQPVKSDWTWTETIFIRSDGGVDPPNSTISSADNVTYTFTDNINGSIVVERDNIVVDGASYTLQGTGSGIDLSDRNNVTIKNMEIRSFKWGIYLYGASNCSIRGNNIVDNHYGIWLYWYSNDNNICGNNLTNNYMFSVYLNSTSHNVISENKITTTNIGVVLGEASKTNIYGNKITNATEGISLWRSSNNSISANSISFTTGYYRWGISFRSSNYNTISENNITNNNVGIRLKYSSNNTFYHNNFIGNTQQVYIETSGYANIWDDGYPHGGNYWSDYTGVDLFSGPFQNQTGSDGIGDTPHFIGEYNQDNYPLMSSYEYWSNPILGDINKDMEVDYKDLFQLTTAYSSTSGKPNWNPNCDFNEDNKVDASDLFDQSKNYGKTV